MTRSSQVLLLLQALLHLHPHLLLLVVLPLLSSSSISFASFLPHPSDSQHHPSIPAHLPTTCMVPKRSRGSQMSLPATSVCAINPGSKTSPAGLWAGRGGQTNYLQTLCFLKQILVCLWDKINDGNSCENSYSCDFYTRRQIAPIPQKSATLCSSEMVLSTLPVALLCL